MSSKRRHEGYLLIDNRAGPGVSADFVRSCGLNPDNVPVVGEGQVFESATITCSHCQKVLFKNMKRTRERGYCSKCDHYICDDCNAKKFLTGECDLTRKRHDEAQESAFLIDQHGGILLPR